MPATCRRCGQPIRFRETANGSFQPIDPDGAVHFATCPARERKEYPDNVCIACGSLNTERGPGTTMHFARLRCLDCNSFRWLPHPRDAGV